MGNEKMGNEKVIDKLISQKKDPSQLPLQNPNHKLTPKEYEAMKKKRKLEALKKQATIEKKRLDDRAKALRANLLQRKSQKKTREQK